jgi:hypothetical protein
VNWESWLLPNLSLRLKFFFVNIIDKCSELGYEMQLRFVGFSSQDKKILSQSIGAHSAKSGLQGGLSNNSTKIALSVVQYKSRQFQRFTSNCVKHIVNDKSMGGALF